MFHPVGSQPPAVYWRRRLLVIGSLVILLVLIVVTVVALSSGGGSAGTPAAAGPTAGSPGSRSSPHTSARSGSTRPPHPTHSSASGSASGSGTNTEAATCLTSNLGVRAVVGKSTYHVGDRPTVEMRVTNNGSAPCVQDLADKQIVLKVFNGESRVWGSHDCEVLPGTNDKTIGVGQSVRVSVNWSGLTSRPGCTGPRQEVGEGTYTLYARLSGKTGKPARFTIS